MKNHESKGFDTVRDADLIELEITHGSVLPWVGGLLQEIQYLRGNTTPSDRVEYLESVLDKLGANYEKETP